jgi:hypothetical protein
MKTLGVLRGTWRIEGLRAIMMDFEQENQNSCFWQWRGNYNCVANLPNNLFTTLGTFVPLLLDSFFCCTLVTTKLLIDGLHSCNDQACHRWRPPAMIRKSFFLGKFLSFFFLFFGVGGLLGLLFPRGFGCSLFLNGSLFASPSIQKIPLVLIILTFTF